MTDPIIRYVFIALAIFGIAANAIGFAFLIYNIVRLMMGV